MEGIVVSRDQGMSYSYLRSQAELSKVRHIQIHHPSHHWLWSQPSGTAQHWLDWHV